MAAGLNPRPDSGPVRVAVVAPGSRSDWVQQAVEAGGGVVCDLEESEALVWFGPRDASALAEALEIAGGAKWVHLLGAGVDPFIEVFDHDHIWTSGKGLSAGPVAEHALALALAGLRGLPAYLGSDSWGQPGGVSLHGQTVTVIGGGGIATELLRLLAPFDCDVTVVRRTASPLAGASRVLVPGRLNEGLSAAQVVFLALALTPETRGLIGVAQFEAMPGSAWIVNISRGEHIVTDDLVQALRTGQIAGAALDTTMPEPLPTGHPLWGFANCIVTPHTATTVKMIRPALAGRLSDNVRRFAAGREMIGLVDVDAGY